MSMLRTNNPQHCISSQMCELQTNPENISFKLTAQCIIVIQLDAIRPELQSRQSCYQSQGGQWRVIVDVAQVSARLCESERLPLRFYLHGARTSICFPTSDLDPFLWSLFILNLSMQERGFPSSGPLWSGPDARETRGSNYGPCDKLSRVSSSPLAMPGHAYPWRHGDWCWRHPITLMTANVEQEGKQLLTSFGVDWRHVWKRWEQMAHLLELIIKWPTCALQEILPSKRIIRKKSPYASSILR